MKKQLLTALLLAVGCFVTLAGGIYAQQQLPISGDANNLPDPPIPESRLKDNSALPDAKLIPKDKITDVSRLPAGAKLIKLEKKPFGVFEQEKGGSRFHDVAPGRQVYEEVISFPEFEHPTLGKVKDATVTVVFDAETGEPLFEEISSKSPNFMPDPHP